MNESSDHSSRPATKRFKRRLAFCLLALLAFPCLYGVWVGVKNARYAAQVSSANCSLKQISLGAHNFHDTYVHFPPLAGDGSDDSTVSVPVSFHTSILPFIEQASLYRSIDKSVPWDDPANKNSFSTVLPTCESKLFGPSTGANGYGLAHYVPNSRLIEQGRGLEFSKITDGLSNTVLDGSIGTSFPAWGDPANARDPVKGFAGGPHAFGGLRDGALIGLADGSVRFISSKTDAKTALSLATPAGGEIACEAAEADEAYEAAVDQQMDADDAEPTK